LTVEKKGKKNVFSSRILEIEGLPNLKVEQAFELPDAAAGGHEFQCHFWKYLDRSRPCQS